MPDDLAAACPSPGFDDAAILPPDGKTVALNTPHARAMLRARFAAPEWALMEEVAPRTGGGTRMADAVAMNLWATRGYALHGFEIKTGRGDWLKELKDPSKAEAVATYCDYWWLVAPAGVVKDGELPLGWGFYELRVGGLLQRVAATKQEAKPVTRAFFASLMRRGHERLESMAGERVHDAIAVARAEVRKDVQSLVEQSTRQHAALQARVEEFEKQTGIPLSGYQAPPAALIALARKLQVLSGWSGDNATGRLERIAKDLDRVAEQLRKAAADTGLQD
jgi:hypothetical protein